MITENFIVLSEIKDDRGEGEPLYPRVRLSHALLVDDIIIDTDDVAMDPLRKVKEVCSYAGNKCKVTPRVLSILVSHPLVNAQWDSYKYLWNKVGGAWRKEIYTFKEDTVLNFAGIDWFM